MKSQDCDFSAYINLQRQLGEIPLWITEDAPRAHSHSLPYETSITVLRKAWTLV